MSDYLELSRTYSRSATIPELFSLAAAAFAEKPALITEQDSLTYAELLRFALSTANLLRELGVGPGHTVGILGRRTVATVGGILGILYAGAAYLALDPSTTPCALLTRQAQLAQLRCVLHDRPDHERDQAKETTSLAPAWLPSDIAWVPLPALGSLASLDAAGDPQPIYAGPTAADPAYIMFTSGSSGAPKGVVVPHRAIVRLVSAQTYIHFGPGERFLLHSPLNFDASTLELWGALLHGSTLVLAPDRTLALDEYQQLIERHSISTLWLTAAIFHMVAHAAPAAFASLTQLVAGGDVVSPSAVEHVRRHCPALAIVNGYGPTESTTFALTYPAPHPYTPDGPLPIGTPIGHTAAYILDEQMEPVPDGRDGQLVLGGDGIALGYIGQPELTASRFEDDPFSPLPGARIYRTGDRARRDATGLIHFRGRLDREIKLSGHRVDLDEIESLLAAHSGVQHAAVFATGEAAEDRRILAAVEPAAAASLTRQQLYAHLADRLPHYALPAQIALFARLPLNPNGKLDRAGILTLLTAPASDDTPGLHQKDPVGTPANAAAPLPDSLSALLTLWRELLESSAIGPDENFFDAGGDSLLLIQLHWRMNQLGRGKIDLMNLFAQTTPRKMAALLDRTALTPA